MSFQQLFFSSGAAVAAVEATGGSIYTNGDYKIHAFTTSANFKVTAINNTAAPWECYVVGGGSFLTASAGNSSGGCDGANGGYGGEGGGYTFASGTINAFTVNTNYFASVGLDGSSSSFGGYSANPYGGGSGGSGGTKGSGGTPPTNGSAGSIPTSITWISGVTTRLGSGGGGGGGGGEEQIDYYNGAGGAPNGGAGGLPLQNGQSGIDVDNLYWPGAGPGGGGGAGGNCSGGQDGGAAGFGAKGLVIIRYKFQNV